MGINRRKKSWFKSLNTSKHVKQNKLKQKCTGDTDTVQVAVMVMALAMAMVQVMAMAQAMVITGRYPTSNTKSI